MRLLITLKATKDQAHDNKYYNKLQGFIYNRLEGRIYETLHNKPDSKSFCFSNIFPTKGNPDRPMKEREKL